MSTGIEGEPTRYRVTAADCEDVEGIFDVQICAIERLAGQHYSDAEVASWLRETTLSAVAHSVESTQEAVLVARPEGRDTVLGYATLRGGRIGALYVHPNHAESGVGSCFRS